jgi:2,3-bisphosphoglycerate-independent phosphoglycerate mutase
MQAALIILDGWGIGDHDRRSTDGASCSEESCESEHRDAVEAARTPTFDRLVDAGAYGRLETSGRRVGLPNGQMGNSEVGHLTIGAGRVVSQEYTRITDTIADGELAANDAIAAAFEYANEHDGRVHFAGLVSDGGVHSDQAHLHALISLAAEREVDAVTHAFTDGRDTAPKAGIDFLADLEAVIERAGTGDVATVAGRYYAMDRDERWERTKRAYDAIVNREADHEAASAVAAIDAAYDRDETDEFVTPTLIEGGAQRASGSERRSREQDGPALAEGDSVLFFNFRADRARQLTRMLCDIRPDWEFDTSPPAIRLTTMTEYDASFDLPVAFPPHQPEDVLGEVLSVHDRTQLRIAESEKYAHVTYFLNGGREVAFDGEGREIIDSPAVPTYDHQPEMSAPELTETAIEGIDREDPDVMVCNYANPDMVGHTGDFDAAIAACEAVDSCLADLVPRILDAGAHLLLTADHGNADDMGTPQNPHTAHTLAPVPLIYLDSEGTDSGRAVRADGGLADVAPTICSLIGVEQPVAMDGESLLE